MARRYRAKGAEPVIADIAELKRMGMQCIFAELAETHGVIRHQANLLAQLLLTQFVQKNHSA